MIIISRALARSFRAVLRRAHMADDRRGPWPAVLCRTDAHGLVLQSCRGEVAVRYEHGGSFAADTLAFDGKLLAEFEGRTDMPVALEAVGSGNGRASWTEQGLPRVLDFTIVPPEKLPAFPSLPDHLLPQPPELLRALAAASASAARDPVRYATSCIQLRGKAGDVVGTDGRQLLVWGGFTFPWKDDLLIPARPIFAAAELAATEPIELGRTGSAVVLRVGSWTLALAVDTQGRFPVVENAIPRVSATRTRLHVDPDDRKYLVDVLPKLPGHQDDGAPVLLDLGPRSVVRAWSDAGGTITEIVLARSSASGPPLQLRMDRRFLRRALQLGFAEVGATGAAAPLCCRDRHRCYVWVALEPNEPTPSDREILCISTDDLEVPTAATAVATTETAAPFTPPTRSTVPMSTPSSNGDSRPDRTRSTEAAPPGGLGDIIVEAEALREVLHDAGSRLARLLAALKLQRRQSRAVQQAMASLKQLQLDR